MKITVHPGAERDIIEAASFYEREGSPALAARFVREFQRVATLLAEHPEIGAPRSRGLRGMTVAIFPYTVIYRGNPHELRILVVKHDRRKPGYGERRS